ncbi:MAG: mandelate racemase/muconate lactonizing enzyme family protein [Parvularculaceae bacterium]
MRRRDFLTAASGAAAVGVAGARGQTIATRNADGLLAYGPETLARTVDVRAFMKDPVIIERIDVLRHSDRTRFVRVRAKGGAEGVVIANMRLAHVESMLDAIFRPMLIGTDARDMEETFDVFFRTKRPRGYKYSGLPYFICQGHCELAIWDMFGRIAGKPAYRLLGEPVRDAVPVYMSRLSRKTEAAEEADILERFVAETGARAVKVKIGGRMSLNADAMPGRTEAVVKAVRERFGDDMTIYVDANGSYDAPTAIAVGRMLSGYGVAMYEEPCDWEDFEMTRQVTRALDIPVSGGEQDTSMPTWRWMAERNAVDVLQPDIMYNGGMIRTLQVARLGARYGREIAPHYPRSGPETAPLIHFCASIPNFKGFMEYRADQDRTDFDYAPRIRPADGEIPLPTGPGFGVEYDAGVLKT